MFNTKRSKDPSITPQYRLQLNAETIRALTSQDLCLVIAGACDTGSIITKKPPTGGQCD
jgi:hypothetical protein